MPSAPNTSPAGLAAQIGPDWIAALQRFLGLRFWLGIAGLALSTSSLVLIGGNFILQSSLTDLRAHIKTIADDVNFKTDSGRLQTSVAVLSERLSALGEVPKKLDTLNESVNRELGGLRGGVTGLTTEVSAVRTEVGGLRTDVVALRTEFKGLDSRLGSIDRRLEESQKDMRVLLQRSTERRGDSDVESNHAALVSAAPENLKKRWEEALARLREISSGSTPPQLVPVFADGLFAATLTDPKRLNVVLKAGFKETRLAAGSPAPPGPVVTIP